MHPITLQVMDPAVFDFGMAILEDLHAQACCGDAAPAQARAADSRVLDKKEGEKESTQERCQRS